MTSQMGLYIISTLACVQQFEQDNNRLYIIYIEEINKSFKNEKEIRVSIQLHHLHNNHPSHLLTSIPSPCSIDRYDKQ